MKMIVLIMGLLIVIFPLFTHAESQNKDLRVTLQSTLISLDPGGIQDSQSWLVSRQVNCQLVRNQGSVFVLDAAQSIKYITPLKIILKISNKAKFHDNSPVTANDVLASLNYIKYSRNILSNLFSWINQIEVLDEKTLIFSLNRKIPQFLKVLSSTNFTIFKKGFLEKAKNDKSLWKHPLGCGGYKVATFSNEYIKLIPVSDGLPITFYLSKFNQVNANDLDKYDIVTLNIIGQSKKLEDFEEIKLADPLQFFIGLNAKSKIWRTKSGRCQFLSALDTTELIKGYGNQAIEANDLIPKDTLGYSKYVKFNDQMKKLSKVEVNREIRINHQPFCVAYLTVSIEDRYKLHYLKMIKKYYPNAYLLPLNNVKKFGKDFINKNCDAIFFAWKSNYFDGYEYLTMFEDNDANFSGLSNKTISDAIAKSQEIDSAKERAEEYHKIINNIGDLCIVRPLFTLPVRKIYVRKNLKTPGIGLISIYEYYLGNVLR